MSRPTDAAFSEALSLCRDRVFALVLRLVGDAAEAEALRRLVESLPPLYEEVMLLRHQEDLDYRAIAEILQAPEDTVKIRLFRARDLLRSKIEAAGLAP